MKHLPEKLRRELLNKDTGQLTWPEIQRYFALGVLICVDTRLDLVTVADKFVIDEKITISDWYAQQLIQRTPDDLALRWANENMTLWAIVVAPWVLVQEPKQ